MHMKLMALEVIFPLPAHTLSKSYYAMDDANIPSLLSLPYLGWVSENDVTYQRTRRYLLSEWNPYFFQGSAAKGIGSPHTGIGWIWPMSIIMQATTSTNDKEITECLEFLQRTDADTEFMHESFWKDNPSQFTRSWFAWANSQFGNLILKLAKERPYLIFRNETLTT
jgi:meiotically up-regulated gene 157 (Mug157) protein